MGKRRRVPSSSRDKSKSLKPAKQENRKKATQLPPTVLPEESRIDIDEDCLQYESQSDEEPASPAKYDAESSEDGDSNGEDEEDSADEILLGEAAADESDVEVELEFFDPTEDDITPISVFLEEYTFNAVGRTKEFSGKGPSPVSSHALSEAICKQTRVGTTIRVTNEKAPIGFISCLNVHEHSDLLKPIKKHILKECDGKELDRLQQLIKKTFENRGNYESQRMGLILSERVVNLPPQIVPKMLEALFLEIEWAVEDEPTVEEREKFRLGWYLYITEVYCMDKSAHEAKEGVNIEKEGKRKAKKQKVTSQDDGGEVEANIAFTRAEDEAWWTHATHKISWPLAGEETGKGGMSRKRMAMVIAASKVASVREMVSNMVREQAEDAEDVGDAEAVVDAEESKNSA